MAEMPGQITFSINSRLLAQGITASDEEVGRAVAFAFRELKLVVEPGRAPSVLQRCSRAASTSAARTS